MSPEIKGFAFDRYVLDLEEKCLRRRGEPVAIPPKILDLLVILVEKHGKIVEKSELMGRLWPKTFVEESNLTFSVRKLRKILSDDSNDDIYIETIPKRGYRFIKDVSQVNSSINDRSNELDRSYTEDAEQKPIATRLSMKNKRPFFRVAALLVSLALVGLYFGWKIINTSPAGVFPVSIERITSNGDTKFAAISPDGRFVSYIVDDEGEQSVWLKNVATGNDIQIVEPVTETSLHSMTFSPDGNSIYYGRNESLYKVAILGGLPQVVLPTFKTGSQLAPITFSPNGEKFAYLRRGENVSSIAVVDVDGSNEHLLTVGTEERRFLRSPVWSPDGKSIAVITSGIPRIVVIDALTGETTPVAAPKWTVVSQLAWSIDGISIFVLANSGKDVASQIWRLPYPKGEAQNLTNDLNDYQSISTSAQRGVIAAVRVEQTAHIKEVRIDGSLPPRQLTNGLDGYDGVNSLTYLYDGSIAYSSVLGGNTKVLILRKDGSKIGPIQSESDSMAVSPDGRSLVFQEKDESGQDSLVSLDISSGEKIRLTGGKNVWMSYSADSKWIVFERMGENGELWKVPSIGGEAIKLISVDGFADSPAVSPDGNLLAFHWIMPGWRTHQIGVLSFNGGDVLKTFEMPRPRPHGYAKDPVQWSPDGRSIDFVIRRDRVCNIWRQPLDGSERFQLTNFTDQQIFNFVHAPDGKTIALSRGTYGRDAVLIKFQ